MNVLFLLLQLFWPICSMLALLLGLEFHIHSEPVYFLLWSGLTFLIWKRSRSEASMWNLALFPATVLVCAAEILYFKSFLAIPSAVLRCCCAYEKLSTLPDKWYVSLVKGINTLLVIGFIALCGFDLTFGSIGKITVIQEAVSPDGSYTAQLIDDNQGALGGSTLVKVTQADILPLGFAAFRPETKTVYNSSWGEFMTTTLSWADETTLLINDTPYPVQ